MTASTHIVAATTVLCAVHTLSGESLHPASICIAMLTSVMPDIDLPSSRMAQACPLLSNIIYQRFGHRTLTHSIFGCAMAALFFLPIQWVDLPVPLYGAALTGYLSHPLLDMANTEGVAFTYPIAPHHRWVFPGPVEYRLRVNSTAEKLLRFIAIVIMSGLLWLNYLGSHTIFHNILQTPEAISKEHYEQLIKDHRIRVQIHGIWTDRQEIVNQPFNVIASTRHAILVRKPHDPLKVYRVSHQECMPLIAAVFN